MINELKSLPSDDLYYIFDSEWHVGMGVEPAPTVATGNITINGLDINISLVGVLFLSQKIK